MGRLSTSNLRQAWHRETGSVLRISFKTIQIQGFGSTNCGDIAASCKSWIGTALPKFAGISIPTQIQTHLFLLKLKGKDTTTSAGIRKMQGKSKGDVTSDQLDTMVENTGGFSDLYLSAATFFASLKYIISVTQSS